MWHHLDGNVVSDIILQLYHKEKATQKTDQKKYLPGLKSKRLWGG